jgi:hypothetical protein
MEDTSLLGIIKSVGVCGAAIKRLESSGLDGRELFFYIKNNDILLENVLSRLKLIWDNINSVSSLKRLKAQREIVKFRTNEFCDVTKTVIAKIKRSSCAFRLVVEQK